MSRPKPLRHSGSGSYGNNDDQEYDVQDKGNDDNNNYSNDNIS